MENKKPPQLDWRPLEAPEIIWVGIDFDDTLSYNTGYPDFIPTTPIPGAVRIVKWLVKIGLKPTIYTARHWMDYHNIERWCEYYGIPIRRIICGKPLFRFIIDDKNISILFLTRGIFKADWTKCERAIKTFLKYTGWKKKL